MSTKKNPRMQLASYKNWCASKLDDLKAYGEKYKDGIPPGKCRQFDRLVNDLVLDQALPTNDCQMIDLSLAVTGQE